MRVAAVLGLLLLLPAGLALPPDPPQPVPDVVAGFVVQPFAVLNDVGVLSALAFGPGDADGPDLYGTTYVGNKVVRFSLTWTPAGPLVSGVSTFATGFSSPLGLVWGEGILYVADSHDGAESGRVDGRVWRVEAGTKTAIVDGLPNGRHNTNHLRFGPDGRMYIANGNPNDNGVDGGAPDVFPYSGAILSVDVDEVTASPALLRWKDAAGATIPPGDIAAHPRNADFAAKVHVLASGFRNVYGVAFGPTGIAYTGMNGADSPSSQDPFYAIQPGTDYGFPFCYNEGPPGGVGADVQAVTNPTFPGHDCSTTAPADALLGWHVCATGLDVPTSGPWAFPAPFANSVYVAECGPFFPEEAMLTNPTYNTGHKVARVALDAAGQPTAVEDFLTGLALPTDVLFGPDGALYVADVVAVHRITSAFAPLAQTRIAPPPSCATGTPYAGAHAGVVTQAVSAFYTLHSSEARRYVVAGVGGNAMAPYLDVWGGTGCQVFACFPVDVAITESCLLPPGEYVLQVEWRAGVAGLGAQAYVLTDIPPAL